MAGKGQALRRGDTIGVVTLGSPLSPEVIDERIRYLQGQGFRVVVGSHVYDENGFLAGTDEERAQDLMRMFTDPRVKLILASRGGVGVGGILPHLDYGYISRNPKLVSGYSDITALLNALYQNADIIALHSLMLIDFRQGTPPYNFEQFFTAATSAAVPREIRNPPGMRLIGRLPGNVTGPIVGGNLTSFAGLLGTPFEIDTHGAILVLEDTHEPVNTVYRYLEHLKLAGKFEDCAGIVMGECHECPEAYGVTYAELIEDFIVPLGKPLLTGLASGHGTYKAAIPIGARARLDASAGTLTLLEPAVL